MTGLPRYLVAQTHHPTSDATDNTLPLARSDVDVDIDRQIEAPLWGGSYGGRKDDGRQ